MRIIAGKWRKRMLNRPPSVMTRPTTDRVKEALFSMLLSRFQSFESLHVVDAFAGSGALGLEALSRGAAHCIFSEKSPKTRTVLLNNIQALNASAVTVCNDYQDIPLQSQKPQDLIFLDPPYGMGLEYAALQCFKDGGIISHHTMICIETASEQLPMLDHPSLSGFDVVQQRCFGTCALSLYTGFMKKNNLDQ